MKSIIHSDKDDNTAMPHGWASKGKLKLQLRKRIIHWIF